MSDQEEVSGSEVLHLLGILLLFGALLAFIGYVLYQAGRPSPAYDFSFHQECFANNIFVVVVDMPGISTPESTQGCKNAYAIASTTRAEFGKEATKELQSEKNWCSVHAEQQMTLLEWRECKSL